MKITDLELEQYGIYQNESWKPAAGCLNVIMGENESGKTTLLRSIRDLSLINLCSCRRIERCSL